MRFPETAMWPRNHTNTAANLNNEQYDQDPLIL